jgi:hypothetical protein
VQCLLMSCTMQIFKNAGVKLFHKLFYFILNLKGFCKKLFYFLDFYWNFLWNLLYLVFIYNLKNDFMKRFYLIRDPELLQFSCFNHTKLYREISTCTFIVNFNSHCNNFEENFRLQLNSKIKLLKQFSKFFPHSLWNVENWCWYEWKLLVKYSFEIR